MFNKVFLISKYKFFFIDHNKGQREIFVVLLYLSRILNKLNWTLGNCVFSRAGTRLLNYLYLLDWKGKLAVKVNWATVSKGDWLRSGTSPQSSHYLRGFQHKQTVDLFTAWYKYLSEGKQFSLLLYYEIQTRRNLPCNCLENMFFCKDPGPWYFDCLRIE